MKIDETLINHNALLQIADITDFLYENTNTNNCADVTRIMMLAEIKGIVDFAKELKKLLSEV